MSTSPLLHERTLPDRTRAQRMNALERGNQIRTIRAQLKRDLKAGRITWLDVLDRPDCATMKIVDVLLALPKYGRVKANKALQRATVSPSKTCAGLTRRQRLALRAEVPGGWTVRPTATGWNWSATWGPHGASGHATTKPQAERAAATALAGLQDDDLRRNLRSVA